MTVLTAADLFQSTHLLRGGTNFWCGGCPGWRFQSTHLLRGGTHIHGPLCDQLPISIHPPPARRDDGCDDRLRSVGHISIHPPPARRDDPLPDRPSPVRHFNPPTSCEAGPRQTMSRLYMLYFNPPTSCEAGPRLTLRSGCLALFQSTHLLRGGTEKVQFPALTAAFQSTHLLRGGTPIGVHENVYIEISIHPPPARRDMMPVYAKCKRDNFNPPTSCEAGQGLCPVHGGV